MFDDKKINAANSVFEKACIAMDENIDVRLELEDGRIYPHEKVVDVDGNGWTTFWVSLSEEGAKVDSEDNNQPGDVVGFSVEGTKIDFV